jgi:predicted nucleic acid-binding protein
MATNSEPFAGSDVERPIKRPSEVFDDGGDNSKGFWATQAIVARDVLLAGWLVGGKGLGRNDGDDDADWGPHASEDWHFDLWLDNDFIEKTYSDALGPLRDATIRGNWLEVDPDRLGDEELAVPHLIDSEVTNVLRRLVVQNILTDKQGTSALDGFIGLVLTRFPADWLRPRMWALRHNLNAYDATYVALAEMTGATALITTDIRLANAPGINCPIELL